MGACGSAAQGSSMLPLLSEVRTEARRLLQKGDFNEKAALGRGVLILRVPATGVAQNVAQVSGTFWVLSATLWYLAEALLPCIDALGIT